MLYNEHGTFRTSWNLVHLGNARQPGPPVVVVVVVIVTVAGGRVAEPSCVYQTGQNLLRAQVLHLGLPQQLLELLLRDPYLHLRSWDASRRRRPRRRRGRGLLMAEDPLLVERWRRVTLLRGQGLPFVTRPNHRRRSPATEIPHFLALSLSLWWWSVTYGKTRERASKSGGGLNYIEYSSWKHRTCSWTSSTLLGEDLVVGFDPTYYFLQKLFIYLTSCNIL